MDFNLSCPGCHGFLTVSDEFVGEVVQCPVCDREVRVLPPGKLAKTEFRVTEAAREFGAEELEAVQKAAPELAAFLDGATNKNCWEFGLIARVLYDGAAPLRTLTASAPAEPPRGPAPRDATGVVIRAAQDFLSIQAELGQLLAVGLPDALYGDDLSGILDFRRRLGERVERLVQWTTAWYAQPLPGAAPFPEVFTTLRDWPAHGCATLDQLVDQMQATYESGGSELRYFDPQVALTPFTLYRFLVLQSQLPGGRPLQ